MLIITGLLHISCRLSKQTACTKREHNLLKYTRFTNLIESSVVFCLRHWKKSKSIFELNLPIFMHTHMVRKDIWTHQTFLRHTKKKSLRKT